MDATTTTTEKEQSESPPTHLSARHWPFLFSEKVLPVLNSFFFFGGDGIFHFGRMMEWMALHSADGAGQLSTAVAEAGGGFGFGLEPVQTMACLVILDTAFMCRICLAVASELFPMFAILPGMDLVINLLCCL